MAMVSIAARVFLASIAGGAGYASVRAGVWEDGKNSQETLNNIKDRLANIKPEILYPSKKDSVTKGSKQLAAVPVSSAGVNSSATVSERGEATLRELANQWNTGVKGVASYLTTSNHAHSIQSTVTDTLRSLFNR